MTTTQRNLAIAGGLILLGLIGWIIYGLFRLEQAPIRVKKGSMDLLLCDGSEWEPKTSAPSSKHWTSKKWHNTRYRVTVKLKSNESCVLQGWEGNLVKIGYSENGKQSKDRVLIHAFPDTRVSPAEILSLVGSKPSRLRYPAAGYISHVEISGGGQTGSCDIKKDDLVYIDICPAVGKCTHTCGGE